MRTGLRKRGIAEREMDTKQGTGRERRVYHLAKPKFQQEKRGALVVVI